MKAGLFALALLVLMLMRPTAGYCGCKLQSDAAALPVAGCTLAEYLDFECGDTPPQGIFCHSYTHSNCPGCVWKQCYAQVGGTIDCTTWSCGPGGSDLGCGDKTMKQDSCVGVGGQRYVIPCTVTECPACPYADEHKVLGEMASAASLWTLGTHVVARVYEFTCHCDPNSCDKRATDVDEPIYW